jgi:MFS family permease
MLTTPKSPVLISPLTRATGSFEMGRTTIIQDDIETTASENDDLLSNASDTDSLLPTSPAKADPWRKTRIQLYICVFIANISFQILLPAQVRIFEQIFCQQYFQQHDPSQIPSTGIIPEDQCKHAAIQSHVARLRSLYSMFDAAPALIMSIPCGIIIDIVGRRPLLLLGLITVTAQQFWVAFICSLGGSVPLEAIWLAPILNFVSGGMTVLNLVFVCIMCDITSKEALATSLFRISAVGQFCKVLGPLISGSLMQFNAWWAFTTGLAGLVLLIAASWSVPETLSASTPNDDTTISDLDARPHSSKRSILQHIKLGFASLSIVWSSRQLIILVLITPLTAFGAVLGDVLQQYISLRYNWTLANAAFLFSLQGIAATISLFILLPLFTKYLTKRLSTTSLTISQPLPSDHTTTQPSPIPPTPPTPPSPTHLNAKISVLSLLILSLSFTAQGLSPTPVLLLIALAFETLGMGCAASLQALAASLVNPKDNGRVLSVLTVAGVLSVVVAHPLTAQLFSVGLDKGGGVWLGMPFLVSAAGVLVAAGVLGCVRWDPVRNDHGGEAGEDEGRIQL